MRPPPLVLLPEILKNVKTLRVKTRFGFLAAPPCGTVFGQLPAVFRFLHRPLDVAGFETYIRGMFQKTSTLPYNIAVG
jgi:hypothetical protein